VPTRFALLRCAIGGAVMLAAPFLALAAYEYVDRWPDVTTQWVAIFASPLPGLIGLTLLPVSRKHRALLAAPYAFLCIVIVAILAIAGAGI